MRVIDNYTTTNGIKLTAVADNPVTITGSCVISIDETAGSAVAGLSYAVIENFGMISAAGVGSAGVGLFAGGTVVNHAGISGETQGIYANYQPVYVNNYGMISGSGKGGRGILLIDGGEVKNHRYINGDVGGIKIEGAVTTVDNYGVISTVHGGYGVKLYGSRSNFMTNTENGVVENGVIAKYSRAELLNGGNISGGGTSSSVYFSYGGFIQNGDPGATTGSIDGVFIAGAAGTVLNFGGISGILFGVDLAAGGSFNNAQPGAVVIQGVTISGAAGTVTNLGNVDGNGSKNSAVLLAAGGTVTNGSSSVTTALIKNTTESYYSGISSDGVASVTNYATISAGNGLSLPSGGYVANTGAAALIAAKFTGVDLAGAPGSTGTLTNTGTISASNPTVSTYGVLIGSGEVVNGSSMATAAQIIADPPGPNPTAIGSSITSTGVVFVTSGSLANFGTVAGARTGVGIAAGTVANGSAGTRTALIEGEYYGVHAAGTVAQSVAITNFGTIAAVGTVGTAGIGIDFDDAANNTVSNSGTISGARGTAVAFGAGDDRLIVQPGAVFDGVVNGGGGGNEIDFHTSGKISLAPEFIGFARVRLVAAASLALKPSDLAGLAGKAITVIDGTAGDTVSAAALTATEEATVKGGAGNDVFVGGAGKDIFTGGAGADTFDFSAAALGAGDRVLGGSGADELVMTTPGTVTATGVGGVETYRLANGKPNDLRLTTGNFIGTIGAAITIIDGNAGDTVNAIALALSDRTTVIGGSGNDVFIGSAGIDFFNGHAGNDTFRFSVADLSSSDVVKGGDGNDTLFLTSAGTVAAGGVSQVETWRLANGGANKLTLTAGNFAGVRGNTITVEGGNSGNTIDAHLAGAADHAVMIGGAGKDVFTGGPGNDTFRFSVADLSAGDVVKGGGGNDTLFLTSAGILAAGGVSGVETYRLADGGADRLTLTAGNFAGAAGATITVEGGNSGNTVDAHLVGAGDHVVMVGGAGKDVFTGGAGNDTFRFSAASLSAGDVVKGGGGNDTLFLTSAGTVAAGGVSGVETYRLANGGADRLTLTAGNFAAVTGATITVVGGDSANTVDANRAGAHDETIMVGGAGEDVFIGGPGTDIFEFSATSLAATDIVQGGGGNDRLQMTSAGKIAATGVSGVATWRLANGGANTLSLANANFAGAARKKITVFGGNDGNTLSAAGVSAADLAVLVGGAGADTLTAGQHAKLTGGGGADQFVFATPGSAAIPDANTITDFTHGLDKIVFRDAGFNLGIDEGKGTATVQAIAASLFSTDTNGSFATTANRFAYNAKTGGLFYDADGSGKADASQRIATLTNDPTLTAGDLFFIK